MVDVIMIKEHIAMLADLKSKTASNVHRLDKHDEQIEAIQKTNTILLSFETKINSIDEKVEKQIKSSETNTETIIKAMLANKKSISDRLLDVIIPIIIMGALFAFFTLKGGL